MCLKHNLDLAKTFLEQALRNMTRKSPVRKARQERVRIDDETKRRIQLLADQNPRLTMHEIASMTGVRSSGRVSEVLNGLR